MSKAYVLVCCETGSENSVISTLKLIDTVKEVHGTFGTYDVIAKLESESDFEVSHALTNKIRRVKKIRSTLTLQTQGNDHFGKKLDTTEKDVLETYLASAYVLINCWKNNVDILENLSKIPEVIEADAVIGYYEAICKVVAPTYNDISDIMTKKIRKLENTKSTITLNIIPENEENGFQVFN